MSQGNLTFDLAYWINERYAIKLRRDKGLPPPWSGDPHMIYVRYCNVHREDDKVTRWLAEHWRPTRHAVWEILLARLLNWIPTLQDVKLEANPWGDLEHLRRVLKDRRDTGAQIFGNAYTVSTNGRPMDKVDYILDHIIVHAKNYAEPEWGTLEGAFRHITRIPGVGSFLAGQVIADLKNTAEHPLRDASDWWQWATHGPGSLRGLEAYYGMKIMPRQFTAAMRKCYEEVKPYIADYVPPIHMQDFQNCLCEFSKYIRVKGGGHVRNRYIQGHN